MPRKACSCLVHPSRCLSDNRCDLLIYGVGALVTRRATKDPGNSGGFRMMIQANSGWYFAASAWMARAITPSMIWCGMSVFASEAAEATASIQLSLSRKSGRFRCS
jgi:hypothetical protein